MSPVYAEVGLWMSVSRLLLSLVYRAVDYPQVLLVGAALRFRSRVSRSLLSLSLSCAGSGQDMYPSVCRSAPLAAPISQCIA